mmetsp:Transcript_18829/g.24447  ORF Transcript_18829/g.24447 Transcript_18829/m.24447 type:complete len:184 (+) Transcript_18829:118-669(+)
MASAVTQSHYQLAAEYDQQGDSKEYDREQSGSEQFEKKLRNLCENLLNCDRFLEILTSLKDTSPGVEISKDSVDEIHADYVGNLWFLRTAGIKFRESLRVTKISNSLFTVTCLALYDTSGSKRFKSCAEVTCNIEALQNIDIKCSGRLLMFFPLPGKSKVVKTIVDTFEEAMRMYLLENGIKQ